MIASLKRILLLALGYLFVWALLVAGFVLFMTGAWFVGLMVFGAGWFVLRGYGAWMVEQ